MFISATYLQQRCQAKRSRSALIEVNCSICAQTDKSACFHHRVIHLLKQRQSLMLPANLLSDWPGATEQEDNQRSMKNLMLTRWQAENRCVFGRECERVKRAHSEGLVVVWICYCTATFNGHGIKVSRRLTKTHIHTPAFLFPEFIWAVF